jgi:hypothetical protein
MDKDEKTEVSKDESRKALEEQISRFFDCQLETIEREKQAFERIIENAQEDPDAALKDKSFITLSSLGKKHQELKAKFEIGFKNLLLAHAGGAVIVINLLPDIIDNKSLVQLSADALHNFAWGLVLLLVSAISSFIASFSNNLQSIMKEIGIRTDWFIKTDFASPLYLVAGTSILISLYLFASAILSAASKLGSLG